MRNRHGNTPAYPQDLQGRRSDNPDFAGLTKREHFAGLAMQGILASLDKAIPEDELAQEAVLAADALLAELEEQP